MELGSLEAWLELRSEVRSDALLSTTVDFSGIWTHDWLRATRIL